jgi:hypothetical protein
VPGIDDDLLGCDVPKLIGNLPLAASLKSVELIRREVMPAFAAAKVA